MKRKIITAILAITVVFSAASCGTAGSKSSNIQSNTQEAVSDTQNSTESTSETAGDTQSEETAATVKDDEKVSGSGTSKSDTSDTTASSSADSKDADSTVKKKNSSDSKSSAKNSTSTAVKHNSTQSTGASNAGTKTNKAADSSTAASNTTSQGKSEHTHKWERYVVNTINHPEKGHYETKVVKAAYDEPQYEYHNVCNKCGKDLGTDDDEVDKVAEHEFECDGSYSCIPVQVGSIHHDAVTEQVYVVDQAAYTENVYGKRCTECGATK